MRVGQSITTEGTKVVSEKTVDGSKGENLSYDNGKTSKTVYTDSSGGQWVELKNESDVEFVKTTPNAKLGANSMSGGTKSWDVSQQNQTKNVDAHTQQIDQVRYTYNQIIPQGDLIAQGASHVKNIGEALYSTATGKGNTIENVYTAGKETVGLTTLTPRALLGAVLSIDPLNEANKLAYSRGITINKPSEDSFFERTLFSTTANLKEGAKSIREGKPIQGSVEMLSAGVYGFSAGVGAGATTSVGANIGIGALKGGAMGSNLIAQGAQTAGEIGKIGGIITAFDVGAEFISTRQISESISSKSLARNLDLAPSAIVFAPSISKAVLETGATGLKAHVAIAGGTAAPMGPAFSSYTGSSGEDIMKETSSIMALSGAFGVVGHVAETKGINAAIGRTQYRQVNTRTGKATDISTGIKVGVEKVNTRTGEGKFYGLRVENTPALEEGGLLQPKGIAEATGKGKYTEQSERFQKEFFNKNLKVNQNKVIQSIQEVAGSKTKGNKIIEATKETGGIYGGSTVERAITRKKAVNPRFGKPSGDIDLIFSSQKDFASFRQKTEDFVKFTKTEGSNFPTLPETRFVESWGGKIQGGGKMDIHVIESSFLNPRPASPVADYLSLSTYVKGPEITTYSTSQQLGTKYMTVGWEKATGNVRPIEPTKTKYMYDVASMGSKSKAETISRAKELYGGKLPKGDLPRVWGKSASVISLPSSSSFKPSSFSSFDFSLSSSPSSPSKSSSSSSSPSSSSSSSFISSPSLKSSSSSSSISRMSSPSPSKSSSVGRMTTMMPNVFGFGEALGKGGSSGYGAVKKKSESKQLKSVLQAINNYKR